jgi:hypothetical protein
MLHYLAYLEFRFSAVLRHVLLPRPSVLYLT